MKKAQKPVAKPQTTPFFAKKLSKGITVKTGVRAGNEPSYKEESHVKQVS